MKKNPLKPYKSKRKLSVSHEPAAKKNARKSGQLIFVIQKHAARRLHYDLRLEVDGVLKSWAVPKGPSLNPKVKRLAAKVEDHPYAYKDFEGIIPQGYGAGSVIVWDHGVYSVKGRSAQESEELMRAGLEKGEVRFFLEGEKLQGEFVLVRMRGESDEWLLIKAKDAFVSEEDITQKERSVLSGKRLEEMGGLGMGKVMLKKAPAKKKPHSLKPMLATLVDAAFDHEEWIFEIKLDGFRALAELNKKNVELYSRNLKSFNSDFPLIVSALKSLNVDAILDGEIVALDHQGISRFQFLQNRKSGVEATIFYFVFDILYLNGKDLRKLPLIERKTILKDLLRKESRILYLDHVENKGTEFLRLAEESGCEGIIGKKKKSEYASGVRTRNWVKIKVSRQQEFVICGFTEPRKSRQHFGALILGVYEHGELRFAGHVGGGFSEKKLQEVKQLLMPLVQKKSPFKTTPRTHMHATWVAPSYLCEVRFSEWTDEGILRQPIFLGIRADKSASETHVENPVATRSLIVQPTKKKYDFITHSEKIYFPQEHVTKGQVLDYYASVSKILLPHLKDKPQSLKRFPEGIEGESFFQKNVTHAPDWLQTVVIEHRDKNINYLLIQDVKSLLYAVNLGCIELHTWLSNRHALEYPEFLVFDLDPEAISFDAVIEVARALYEVLEKIGVPSYCKTTGATGMHICVPLKSQYTYEQAKQFCLMVATYVQGLLPGVVSLERRPSKRQNKVYIDCFQNNIGQTIAAAYALRARPGAPVSTPLEWKEVQKGIDPTDYNLFNIRKRLEKKGDLFKQVLQKGINMKKALGKFNALFS